MLRPLTGSRRAVGFARRTHALRTLARIDDRLGIGRQRPSVDAPRATVPVDPQQFRDGLSLNSATSVARYGDIVQPFQRQRYADLDSALVAVAMGETPPCGRHWWEATKGASKDTDLAMCVLWLLAHSDRFLDVQIGAADREQSAELKKAAQGVLHHNAWLRELVDIQQAAIVNKRTGSTARFVAAENAGSHGARPDVLILNELHAIKPQHREFAQNLMDNARKVPNGVVVIATNAGDVGSWQWEWREYARLSPRWAFHRLAQPAPWIGAAEIEESARTNSPARHQRLWYGVWAMGKEGAEWEKHPEYFGDHLWALHEWPDRFDISVIACDPSKGKSKTSDPSAIVFAGVARGLIWVRADIEVRPAEQIVTRLVDTYYGGGAIPNGVVIEENQFQHLLAPLVQHECAARGLAPLPISLYTHSAAADKKTRIRRIGAYLERRLLRIRNDEGGLALVRMLRNFGTDSDNDDGPDALEMAIRLINQLTADRFTRRPEERVRA